MASRLSSLPAITIGSDKSGVVQGSEQLDAQAGARKVKWGSVQQMPRQMQFLQAKWTGALGGQRVEERWGQQRIYRAPRRVEDTLAAQLLGTAERKVKQLAEEIFNRAADEEKRTKRQREADVEDARKRRKKQQKQKKKKKKKQEIEQRQQEVKEQEDEENYWSEVSWTFVEDAAMEKAEAWHQRRSAERALKAVRAGAESVRREKRQTPKLRGWIEWKERKEKKSVMAVLKEGRTDDADRKPGHKTQELVVAESEDELDWMEVMSAVQMMQTAAVSIARANTVCEQNPLFEGCESAEPAAVTEEQQGAVESELTVVGGCDALVSQSHAYCTIHIEENQIFGGAAETMAEPVKMSGEAVTEAVGAVALAAEATDGSVGAADGAAIQAAERASTEVAKAVMREAANIDSTLGGYGQHWCGQSVEVAKAEAAVKDIEKQLEELQKKSIGLEKQTIKEKVEMETGSSEEKFYKIEINFGSEVA